MTLHIVVLYSFLSLGSHYEIAPVQKGGSLRIANVDSSRDNGIFTCIVRAGTGEEARRDLQVNVKSPPVIEPFSFPKSIQEGGRAQVTCTVTAGDMPVTFNWQKDGLPLPMSLYIQEKRDEFFSMLVFKDITALHSGKYTCFASNSAAKINFTAKLLVKGKSNYLTLKR